MLTGSGGELYYSGDGSLEIKKTTVTGAAGTLNLTTPIDWSTFTYASPESAPMVVGTNLLASTNRSGQVTVSITPAGITPNLSAVLVEGNSAGSTDINMNSQAVTNAKGVAIGDATYSTQYPLNIEESYNGVIRAKVKNSYTLATAVQGAVYHVEANNDSQYASFGMTGTNSTFHGGIHDNRLHIYNRGYGETMSVVDGNKGFLWGTDPSDSHNYLGLTNIVMQLSAAGVLDVSGTVEAGAVTENSTNILAVANGKLGDIVDDTTPQFGGNLDANAKTVTNLPSVSFVTNGVDMFTGTFLTTNAVIFTEGTNTWNLLLAQ